MNRSKAIFFLPVLLLAALSLAACNGPKTGTICISNCGSTGTVAVTMVADTLPANPALLTFQVTIASVTFTPASGTATTVNLNPALTVDLMRLQTDTVLLGAFANIPAAQYNSATLTLSGSANITFLNDTPNTTISGCPPATICPLSVAASSNPVATVSFTVSPNAVSGIGIDLNFANAVSISGNTLVDTLLVNFNNNNVLSGFTLPRQGSNLSSSQFDLLEDFTGIVSLSGNTVTITSPSRGTLTATATSNTNFDANPDPTKPLCPAGTSSLSACVSAKQVASVDAVLNSDGTLSIQEIEPLLPSQQDIVEGLVATINQNNQPQFVIIVTDKPSVASPGSLIGSLNIGDGLTVNIPNPNLFLVDTKGLSVGSIAPGTLSFFAGATTAGALHPGQIVAVHVSTFTAASGNIIASSNADTVILRWSRLTASPSIVGTQTLGVTSLPTYFASTSGNIGVQLFQGTQGQKGVTSFDGIPDGSFLNTAKPASFRALFIEDPSNSVNFPFFAAKVRQH